MEATVTQGCEMMRLAYFLDNLFRWREVSFTCFLAALYPQENSWYLGLSQLKDPLTSVGMEPRTFWLVAY
jgi:hypothetical protein